MRAKQQIAVLTQRLDDQEKMIVSLFRAVTGRGIAVEIPREKTETEVVRKRGARTQVKTTNSKKHWTQADSDLAWSMHERGMTIGEIAHALGRSHRAIDSHLSNRRHGR